MALSGSFEGKTNNPRLIPKISWSATQSIEENYSDVTAKLQYYRTNSGYTSGGTWKGSLTINDNTLSKQLYMEITYGNTTTVITHTVRVYHDDLGKASVKISGTGDIVYPAAASLKNTQISKTVTLDTIKRASTITSVAPVTLGNACSIKWTPNSATFWYKLKFSIGSWEYTTEALHPNKTSAYTYTGYTLPLEIAEQITNASQSAMTVTLTTYLDSNCTNSIGSNSQTFNLTVPDNADTQPTVTMELTAESPFEGLYVQGLSKVQAKLNAEGKLGARIESYSVNVEGSDYKEPYLSNTLQKEGPTKIIGYAKDSRGITGSVQQDIEVLPYYIPKLTNVEVCRCTYYGEPADNGEYLKIKATRDYAPVMLGGKQHNFCSIQYQYKAENAENYIGPFTILASDAADDTVTTPALLNATFYKDIAYSVQIIAVDTVGRTATATVFIPSEYVFRHKPAGGRALGLGGYCDPGANEMLDVHWNQRVRKNLTVDGEFTVGGKQLLDLIYPVGSIYMSVSDCDPALLFGGTWERLKDRFLLAAGDAYAAGTEGGAAEVTLTEEQMPEHNHEVQLTVYGYDGWNSWTTKRYGVMFNSNNANNAVYYHDPGETLKVADVSGNANTVIAGGNAAHNNMPPYMAVYIYKRTA